MVDAEGEIRSERETEMEILKKERMTGESKNGKVSIKSRKRWRVCKESNEQM